MKTLLFITLLGLMLALTALAVKSEEASYSALIKAPAGVITLGWDAQTNLNPVQFNRLQISSNVLDWADTPFVFKSTRSPAECTITLYPPFKFVRFKTTWTN